MLRQVGRHDVELDLGIVVEARREGRWLEEASGRVVRLLGIDGAGRALLDLDGSGSEAGQGALAELGIAPAELEALATLYTAGTSLWRVAVPHFSPWDLNWPMAPPPDAVLPPPDPDEGEDPNDPDDPEDSPDPRDHRNPADPADPSNPETRWRATLRRTKTGRTRSAARSSIATTRSSEKRFP